MPGCTGIARRASPEAPAKVRIPSSCPAATKMMERNGFRGDPEREAKVWLEKLADAERKRSSFQDMAAEGLITFDELRTKLAALQETCETARHELATLEDRRNRLKDLEHDAATLLESYAGMVPEALGNLNAEERNHVYKMLRLKVSAYHGGTLEVIGTFGGGICVSDIETLSTPSLSTTSSWIQGTSTPYETPWPASATTAGSRSS
jgi:hypothetical protein